MPVVKQKGLILADNTDTSTAINRLYKGGGDLRQVYSVDGRSANAFGQSATFSSPVVSLLFHRR
jgi:hypothetical protein